MKVVAGFLGFLGGTIWGAVLGYIAGYIFAVISILTWYPGDGIIVCAPIFAIIGAIAGATVGTGWGLDKMGTDETKLPE